MDLMMPEMDGIAGIKEIKHNPPGAHPGPHQLRGEDLIFPASRPAPWATTSRIPHRSPGGCHPQVYEARWPCTTLIARKVLEELQAGPQRRLTEDP